MSVLTIYVLGYTAAEHERLIRQAALIAPYTERLFRQAGIGRGQRVLDVGSGVGDVSMLLARIAISKHEIKFWAKDRKLRRRTIISLKPEAFLAAWTQHIPERYEHAVRSFGIFAPRAIRMSSAAVFTILGQNRMPRPKPLKWNLSIQRDFGWDPLVDSNGNRMIWTRRIAPRAG